MKEYYDMQWEGKYCCSKINTKLEKLEEYMGIKLPRDFKEFIYRNNNGEYPDWDNCVLFNENGEVVIELSPRITSYIGVEYILEILKLTSDDIGEIYYWHLPLMEVGPEKVILDYTHCKENPPVVWVDEESGPYEDALGSKHWKRYIAPTFKDFIEMIGDRNKPVGDWIDQNLMADGTVVSDEEAEKMPRQ